MMNLVVLHIILVCYTVSVCSALHIYFYIICIWITYIFVKFMYDMMYNFYE